MKRSGDLARRATPRRVTPLRQKSERQRWIERLDKLARALVMRRDQCQCVRCGGRERLQWAHVHSRGRLSLRWRPENSMMLCAGCHLWWHHRPVEAVQWWWAKYPTRATMLEAIASSRQKLDLRLEELWLRQRLAA